MNRVLGWALLGLLLATLPIEATQADAASAVTVALVSSATTEHARTCLDLLTARLTGEASLRLLERAQIDRVLAEHRLQLALGDAELAAQAGSLLGAQWLAVLEMSSDGREPTALVVFESATTKRLVDVTLDAKFDEAVDDAARAICSASVRRSAPEASTLCVLSIRNVDLPPTFNTIGDGLMALWERRLLGGAGVTLLERGRLDQLIRERQIAGGPELEGIHKAVLLAEAQFSRGEQEGQCIWTIHLSNAARELVGQVTQEFALDQAGEAVALMLAQTAVLLRDVRAEEQTGDMAKEARRFCEEAQRLIEGSDPQRGARAAEAAYALAPDGHHPRVLATALFAVAVRHLGGTHKDPWVHIHGQLKPEQVMAAMIAARRAIDILHADLERSPTPSLKHFNVRSVYCRNLIDAILYTVNDRSITAETLPPREEFKQRVRAYNQLVSDRRMAFVEDQCVAVIQSEYHVMGRHTASASTMAHLVAAQSRILQPILRRLDQPGVKLSVDEAFNLHEMLRWIHHPSPRSYVVGGGVWPEHAGPVDWTQRQALIEPLLKQLQDHSCAELRWHARLLREADQTRRGPDGSGSNREPDERNVEARQRGMVSYEALVSHLLPWLDALGPTESVAKVMGYLLWREAIIMLVLDLDLRGQQAQRLVTHMLDQRIMIGMLMRDLMTNFDRTRVDVTLEMTQAVARALEMMTQKQAAITVGWSDYHVKMCQRFLANSPHARGIVESLVTIGSRQVLPQGIDATMPFMEMTLIGSDLFLLGSRNQNSPWECWRLAVTNGEPGAAVAVGKLPRLLKNSDVLPHQSSVPAAAIARDTLFWATHQQGILAYPLAGGESYSIETTQGLPSSCITALASVGSSLIIGAGEEEGYLLMLDLDTRQWRTLASSRRKQKQSPLDDLAEGFTVYDLLPLNDGRTFIASISVMRKGSSASHPLSGLWQLDAQSGELTLLVNARGGHDLAWVVPGRTIWADGWWSGFIFDLATREARLLRVQESPATAWLAERLGEGLRGQTPKLRLTRYSCPNLLLDENRLFAGHPLGVFRMTDGRYLPLAAPWPGDEPNVVSVQRLLPLEPGRLLILRRGDLWQVDWRLPD
jgi:hypothetical protein